MVYIIDLIFWKGCSSYSYFASQDGQLDVWRQGFPQGNCASMLVERGDLSVSFLHSARF